MAELTLRIEHVSATARTGSLRLALLAEGVVVSQCAGELAFEVSAADRERIRWYWEDYLDYPAEDAKQAAEQTERRLEELGESLFDRVFGTPPAGRLWDRISPGLSDLRIEIVSPTLDEHPTVPWELLREKSSRRWLAAECGSFVRSAEHAPVEALFKSEPAHRLRVLAVICRPSRMGTIAFRPDFQELSRRLGRHGVEWEVLRPPTFGKLTTALLEAEAFGEPFHVLHFDGLALAADLTVEASAAATHAARQAHDEPPPGMRGYLAMHHAQDSSKLRLVDATALIEALGEARTPIVTLSNCCELQDGAPKELARRRAEIHEGFRRLAQELSAFGVAATGESPYCLDPDAAAGWFETFDAALARGRPWARRRRRGGRPCRSRFVPWPLTRCDAWTGASRSSTRRCRSSL